MTRIDDLLSELANAVGGRDISYNSSSAAWDIYEGYAFALVIRAAAAAGGAVSYEDRDGNSVSRLLFRTSPGMLYSMAHPYTHAVLSFPGCDPLEMHVGVRVQGKSGVLHECDVLVLPVDEANLSRTKNVAPRGTRALIAVECKYYASHLSLYLARGFHGLHSDLGLKYPYFVTNLRALRIERYLTYHNRNWENGVIPNSRQAVYFEGQVREAFKKYQSIHGALAP
jgi:hypothetical protein